MQNTVTRYNIETMNMEEPKEKIKVSDSQDSEFELIVYWDVAPCSHVEVDRRFRGAYCLYHRPDDRCSTN
jgi:hypothetical protein